MRRRIVNKLFSAIEGFSYGAAEIVLPDGSTYSFKGKHDGPHASYIVTDWRALEMVAAKSDIGFAESYMLGYWETPDLKSLLLSINMNMGSFKQDFYGQSFYKLIYSIQQFFRSNTKSGSAKNIAEHYDLGNDFYKLWLDPSMTYSSALFSKDEGLEEAQNKKYDRIIERLGDKGKNILEIGCGWGGFLERAAIKGCQVTGITISQEQLTFAKTRLEKKNLSHKSQALIQDYRDANGQYTGIVSIEMFEAVGEAYWDGYFKKISDVLIPGGEAIIQTISIAEEFFEEYRSQANFIQKYIFPGGMLPTKTVMVQYAEKYGLKLMDRFDFGKSYAQTLEIWLANFDKVHSEVLDMGFSPEFIHKWRLYLASCYASFLSKRTDVSQFHYIKV